MTPIETRLAEIAGRAEKAKQKCPGEWAYDAPEVFYNDDEGHSCSEPAYVIRMICLFNDHHIADMDLKDGDLANFMASASEDIPFLLSLVADLTKERDELQGKLEGMPDKWILIQVANWIGRYAGIEWRAFAATSDWLRKLGGGMCL